MYSPRIGTDRKPESSSFAVARCFVQRSRPITSRAVAANVRVWREKGLAGPGGEAGLRLGAPLHLVGSQQLAGRLDRAVRPELDVAGPQCGQDVLEPGPEARPEHGRLRPGHVLDGVADVAADLQALDVQL